MQFQLFNKQALTTGQVRMAIFFLVPFMVVLTALIVFFVLREQRLAKQAQLSELKEAAQAFYEQIAAARSWNAGHGGVYAEITGATIPNPYLRGEDRDIVTTRGRRLTKINPAYMTRQLSEIAAGRDGTRFRIIGFRPLNPANTPKGWEEPALSAMAADGGRKHASRFEEQDGKRFFTYLMPLVMEQACIACHGAQGFGVGDLKGAIAISVPTARFDAMLGRDLRKTIISLSAVGLFGMICTIGITVFLCRRLHGEIALNIDRGKRLVAMELAGAAAHELRQPLTVLLCVQEIVQDKVKQGETISDEDMVLLRSQCLRINSIIERLMQVMNYKTKRYAAGINILDLEACASAASSPGMSCQTAQTMKKESR